MPGHYGKSSKGAVSKKLIPKSAGPISSVAKKAIKKAGAEGPKKSIPRKRAK